MLNFATDESQMYSQVFGKSADMFNTNNYLDLFNQLGADSNNDTFNIFEDNGRNDFATNFNNLNDFTGNSNNNSNNNNNNNNNMLDSTLQETLMNFQDLGLPNDDLDIFNLNVRPQSETEQKHTSQPSFRKHSKKPSGAALFGIHGRELSIPGINPMDLNDVLDLPQDRVAKSQQKPKAHRILEQKEATLSKDYIMNSRPTSYKFPPDPVQSSLELPTNLCSRDSEKSNLASLTEQSVIELDSSGFPTPLPTANNSPVKRQMNVQSLGLQLPSKSRPAIVQTPPPKEQSFLPMRITSPFQEFVAPQYVARPLTPASFHGSPLKDAHSPTFSPEYITYTQQHHQQHQHQIQQQQASPQYVHMQQKQQQQQQQQQQQPASVHTPVSDQKDSWEVMVPNPQTDAQSPTQLISGRKKRKCGDKVSTLPPGFIDQFVLGPDENKKYVCNYKDCGKVFQRRYNIRSHIQTHLCDRPYKCSYPKCPKGFVRQHDLHRHERIHENNKFICACGKGFTRVDALQRHTERRICSGAKDDTKLGSGLGDVVAKPKKKRGRPKRLNTENGKLADKLEQTLDEVLEISRGSSPLGKFSDQQSQQAQQQQQFQQFQQLQQPQSQQSTPIQSFFGFDKENMPESFRDDRVFSSGF